MDILTKITEKNWPKKELEQYQRILYRGEVNRTPFSRFLHSLNYLLILTVLILGNGAIAFILLPIFIITDELLAAFFLMFLGILYGIFSDTIIYHIDGASDNYYAIIAGFLPVVLIGIFTLAALASNLWAGLLQLPQGMHNPLTIAAVYSASYLLPFFYHVYKRYYEQNDEALVE